MQYNPYKSLKKFVGTNAKNAVTQAKEKALEEYWPTIEQICRTKFGPAALHIIQDDTKLTSAIGALYAALPLPLRLVVGESDFLEFCLLNKNKLLLRFDTNPTIDDSGNALSASETKEDATPEEQ